MSSFFNYALDNLPVVRRIRQLRRRAAFRDALKAVYATADGKLVLDQLFRDCNVTGPVASNDPLITAANEGRRQLAMSYLAIMGQDDIEHLLARLESERADKNQNTDT